AGASTSLGGSIGPRVYEDGLRRAGRPRSLSGRLDSNQLAAPALADSVLAGSPAALFSGGAVMPLLRCRSLRSRHLPPHPVADSNPRPWRAGESTACFMTVARVVGRGDWIRTSDLLNPMQSEPVHGSGPANELRPSGEGALVPPLSAAPPTTDPLALASSML